MNGYNNLTTPYGQYYQNLMPQQPTNSNSSLMTVLVSSEEEVNNYPVAAGMTVMLMDFAHKRFWLKSTAMNGVPQAPFLCSEGDSESLLLGHMIASGLVDDPGTVFSDSVPQRMRGRIS